MADAEKRFIGLRDVDGSVHELFDTQFQGMQSIVLTTVVNHQESVEIYIYQSSDTTFAKSDTIGRLVVHNLLPLPEGEVDIDLNIGIDEYGYLQAQLMDAMSGEYDSLTYKVADRNPAIDSGDARDDDSEEDGAVDSNEEAWIGMDPQISFKQNTVGASVHSQKKQVSYRRLIPLLFLYLLCALAAVGSVIILISSIWTADVPPLHIFSSIP